MADWRCWPTRASSPWPCSLRRRVLKERGEYDGTSDFCRSSMGQATKKQRTFMLSRGLKSGWTSSSLASELTPETLLDSWAFWKFRGEVALLQCHGECAALSNCSDRLGQPLLWQLQPLGRIEAGVFRTVRCSVF